MADRWKWKWLLALGILTLSVAPATAGPADKPGIDGRIPEPPSCHVLRDVLWPPSNRFMDSRFQAETEPGNRILTFIYSNTYPFKGYLKTGWGGSLSLRASLKRPGFRFEPEPRVYLIVVAANSPMGGWAYSTCTVVVPVNPGLTALEEARERARDAEHRFHETGRPPDGYFTVLDADGSESLPTVTIAASDPTASEAGPDDGVFTVTRTAPGGDMWPPLTVYYERSGTATHETDYQELSSSVTIPAGSASADIHIYPSDDGQVEGPETVTLTLAPDAAYDIGSPSQATVNIEDNDFAATVTIDHTDGNASEAGDPGEFTITRTGDTTWPLTVHYTVSGNASFGSDFNAELPGMIEIPAGESSVTITITPIDDGDIEPAETVTLTLSANSQYELGVLRDATVTIADDDMPVVTIEATQRNATEFEQSAGEFTITRTGGSTADALTVQLNLGGSAAPGDDYTTLPQSIEIPAGETSVILTVTPVDDSAVEGDEQIFVSLRTDDGYALGDDRSDIVTIVDNDFSVVVTIQATDSTAAETGDDPGQLTVYRTGDTSAELVVGYTVNGSALPDGDYMPLSGTVTIPAGAGSATIDVTPVDDTFAEGDETVIVTLWRDDDAYHIGSAGSATVTIFDDSTDSGPKVTIAATDADAAETGPDAGTVTVTRTGDTTNELTVYYTMRGSAFPGEDYTPLTGSVTIAAGATSAEITITPIDDAEGEPTEAATIVLEADPGYDVELARDATVMIADNEPIVTVEATAPTVSENGSSTGRFTVTRTGDTSAELVVHYKAVGSATEDADFAALGTTVAIPAGASTAEIVVTPINDTIGEGDETVVVQLEDNAAYWVGKPWEAEVTISDDEPVVTIAATDNIAAEDEPGNKGAFTVTRTGSRMTSLTVFYNTTGSATPDVDYTALSGSVTIPAGASSATIEVVALPDGLEEGRETVLVALQVSGSYHLPLDTAKSRAEVVIEESKDKYDVTIDINNTPAQQDDITHQIYGCVQHIKARITNLGAAGTIDLQVTHPWGDPLPIKLSKNSLTLDQNKSEVIEIEPLMTSREVNDIKILAKRRGDAREKVGQEDMTVVTVSVPKRVRAPNTWPGVSVDRIPPRVDTEFTVYVIPDLKDSGQYVTLEVTRQSADNGTVKFNDGGTLRNTLDLAVPEKVIKLRGVDQTKPKTPWAGPYNDMNPWDGGHNKQELHLQPRVHGELALGSAFGFSVAAIPQNYDMTFDSLVVQDRRGILVISSWESDSGSIRDLHEVEIKEMLEDVSATGIFVGVPTKTSGYFRVVVNFIHDRHAVGPVADINAPGTSVAHQLHIYRDRRTGDIGFPCPKSGYKITHEVFSQNGTLKIKTTKAGADVKIYVTSKAGAGSVSKTQIVATGAESP